MNRCQAHRLGQWTYYEYNNLRQRTKVIDPLGHITKYEYCSCGSPDYIREAFGTADEYVTQRAFDYQGRHTHTFQPGGINLTNTYDSLGRLTKMSDALGSTTNYFDNLGRLTIVSNLAGLVQRAYYDDHDLVRTNIDANGVTTTLTYDDLHRLRIRTVNSAGTEAFGYTGNLSGPTSYTNQLGKVTQYAYHAAGWKTNEVIVGMATNKFSYDPAGNLRTLRDGKDQLTSWGYDPYGRMASKTNDNNVVMLAYLYDANGRLTNRWSAAKGSTGYAYDAAGNLTNVNYPSSTDIQYAYDALDRMSTMVDASGTTTWTYDLTNRYSVEDGPWVSDNVTNRWNTAGQRDTMAIQQPHASSYFNTAYAYDAASRLTNITSGAGTYSYYYHPGLNGVTGSSRLVQRISLPNTSFITNSFDGAARWTDTYLKTSASATLNRHSYVYNNANQRTEQTVTDGSYYDYGYDDAGQLSSALAYTSGGTPISALNRGYQYDPAWNMTRRTNGLGFHSYTVNNLNQVTASVGGGHTYDSNGNMIFDEPASNYQRDFAYDDENQLTQITKSYSYTPYERTEFVYDGKMRLRKTVEYTWLSPYGWYPGSETRYVYDGMLVVQERNSANTPAVTYTRGLDLSGPAGAGQGAGGIGGLLGRSHGYSTATGAWSTHSHYHADGNGNITYLVNASQGLAASYKYDPFGNNLGMSGALASANLYRFSSKMFHTKSGLYYYGYRFYSPGLQRWMNRDPLGEQGHELARTLSKAISHWSKSQIRKHAGNLAQLGMDPFRLLYGDIIADGPNLYRFVRNSPFLFLDPDGRSTVGCAASVAWCIGGTMLAIAECNPWTGWLTCGGSILAGPVAGCLSAIDACGLCPSSFPPPPPSSPVGFQGGGAW